MILFLVLKQVSVIGHFYYRYAAKKDVPLMTFDNETELHKIAAHYPNAQFSENKKYNYMLSICHNCVLHRLVIRIKADADDALVKLGAKFGCSMSEVFYLLQVAHRHLGLNVIGVRLINSPFLYY